MKSALFALAAGICLNGCNESAPLSAGDTKLSNLHTQATSKLAEIQAMQPPIAPPSIVNIGIDQSGSMQTARVAEAKLTDVELVLKSLSRTGGTFAMSSICDRSDRPLIRTTFPEPPRLNITAIPAPPQRPDTSRGNPFKHQKELKTYYKDAKTYPEQITAIYTQLNSYQQQIEQYYTNNQQRINALKSQLQTVFKQPRNCQATDIQRAVQRANWLFNEPNTLSQMPRKYAVFITDGLDTFSVQPIQLKADQVVLVNGSSDVGVFQSIEHQRFESPNAAFSTLAEWMVRKK
ncbi:hypothetical protein CDG77_28540 [Nostoc sp. 'Peltigera membranacea cyanobiont' 213]|nr:hypothetical protein CDG77_28540 [Nostoc sp. 'Peltigera membranacea cyanobiont' 213]